jgi:hypothetical protein
MNYLKFKNNNVNNIFIRPNINLDRALIVVDNVAFVAAENIISIGYNPACVVETSSNNYPAWISFVNKSMPKEHRKFLVSIFANQF